MIGKQVLNNIQKEDLKIYLCTLCGCPWLLKIDTNILPYRFFFTSETSETAYYFGYGSDIVSSRLDRRHK